METTRICPSCQKPLPADVPLGLCPECLIKSGFNTGTEPGNPGKESGFVPPPVEELRKLFPQLEILELIGKGGMGAVYKARQMALDRLVALKILPPGAADDAGFAERFNREARALARLNHPHIVAVHDFGQAGGQPYLVMEFVDGPNLRQVEQAGRLTPEQALQIVPQICEALQFAHNEGVVHRDIKPENILLDKKGRVKITDFGIAKIVGVPAGKISLTGAKDVLGTPHYMAPEQVEKPSTVDHRADIYSLGVVFYELLTGELPLGKFQPPSKKVQVDVRLDEVVLHTLEKEPERRYQQASQVKTDVETIAATPSSGSSGRQSAPTEDQSRLTSAATIRSMVKPSAIGLIITGILNWIAIPLIIFVTIGIVAGKTGSVSAFPTLVIPLSAMLLSSVMIVAGLKMKRLEAYPLAIIGSILAILVMPGNIIGLPVGIWCLVVLCRREVREAFGKDATFLATTPQTARPWWKRWWAQVAYALLLALIIRTAFVQPFSAATDAAAPEIPRGSRFLVWKPTRVFGPGDVIAYRWSGRVNVGRVVRSADRLVLVNRNGEADAAVARSDIIGKVISIYWRARAPGASARSEDGQSMAFSPVREITLNDLDDRNGNEAFSFASGQVISLFGDFGQRTAEARVAWLDSNRVDLLVDFARDRWALLTRSMKFRDLPNEQWDAPDIEFGGQWPESKVLEKHERRGDTFYLLPPHAQPPLTFGFQTAGGNYGVLQITGFNEHPRGVKLRYKLAQLPGGGGGGISAVSAAPGPVPSEFGPVFERVVNGYGAEAGKQGLNFRSTALFSIPERELTNSELRRKWLMDRNIDLLVMNKGGAKWQLAGPDLKVARLSEEQWDQASPEEASRALAAIEMETADGWPFYAINDRLEKPLTFAFHSGSGADGLLQLTGYTERPRGVKLRYKLAQSPSFSRTADRVDQNAQRKFVRLVADKTALTFEGQPTSWDGVSALLASVPERKNTVLEFAVTSDQITVAQQNEWFQKATALARQHGFEYASFIGIHPLGSKGTSSSSSRSIPPLTQAKLGEFKVTLTNGLTLEVVAVARNPRGTNLWWQPDGTPLAGPPVEIVELPKLVPTTQSRITIIPQNEFLFYIRRQMPLGLALESFQPRFMPRPGDIELPATVREIGSQTRASAQLVCFAEPPDTVDYQEAVACGPWEAVSVYDVEAKTARDLERGMMALWSEPRYEQGALRFDVMHNADREQYALRMVARLRNGGSEKLVFHSGVLSGAPTKGYALIHRREQEAKHWLQQVQEMVIERTPWISGVIHNIALQPKAASVPAVSAPPTGNPEVLAARLRLAETEATRLSKLADVGQIAVSEIEAAREKVTILQAEMRGDSLGAARTRLAAAQRQFKRTAAQFQVGRVPKADCDAAQMEITVRQAELAAAPAQTGVLAFGPVTERTVSGEGDARQRFIDFDTGELFAASEFFGAKAEPSPEETQKWWKENSIDAMGDASPAVSGLVGFDMIAVPVPLHEWDMPPARLEYYLAAAKPGTPAIMSAKGDLPATFVIQTREGGRGLLQITGFSGAAPNTRSVMIRYKLLNLANAAEGLQAGLGQTIPPTVATISNLIATENWAEMMKLFPQAIRRTDKANTVESDIRIGIPILLEWDMSLPMAFVTGMEKRPMPEFKPGCWLEFPPDRDRVIVHLRHDPWPHAAWHFHLEILDDGGTTVQELDHTLENTGRRPPKRQWTDEQSEFSGALGHGVLDRGKRFRLSVESLWTEQDGEFQPGVELPLYFGLSTVDYTGMFRAEGLKVDATNAEAIVRARVAEWPKAKWNLALELFDSDGHPAGEGQTVAENGGWIVSRVATGEREFRFPVKNLGSGTRAPQRLRLRVEAVSDPPKRADADGRSPSSSSTGHPANQPAATKLAADKVVVEDLALRMLAAIRDKEDDVLQSLAVDRIKGWRASLPHFAFEARERFQQMRGRPFNLLPTELLVEGDYAVVKCDDPKATNQIYLALQFVRTEHGWKNWSLRNSPPAKPLAEHLKQRPPTDPNNRPSLNH